MKIFLIMVITISSVFTAYGNEKEIMESTIIPYEDMEQVMILAETKPTILFFKANWCPSCNSAAKDFEKNIDMLNDVIIVVVNYDKSKDLKVKYGVTYQHTFVQVSPEGKSLVKWNGGKTKQLLDKVIKDYLEQ